MLYWTKNQLIEKWQVEINSECFDYVITYEEKKLKVHQKALYQEGQKYGQRMIPGLSRYFAGIIPDFIDVFNGIIPESFAFN